MKEIGKKWLNPDMATGEIRETPWQIEEVRIGGRI